MPIWIFIYTICLIACSKEPVVSSGRVVPATHAVVEPGPIGAFARSLAGTGATDCGVGRDRASDQVVYDCAAKQLTAGVGFVATFETWNVADRDDVIAHEYEQPPAAYAGTRGGAVHLVQAKGDGFHATPILQPGASADPRPLVRGMRRPSVVSKSPVSITVGESSVSGVAVIEITIGEDGQVEAVRILKSVAGLRNADLTEAIGRLRFSPAKLFDRPLPVVQNISVRVRAGRADLDIRESAH